MQEEFGPEEYGLDSLLADGREQVSELVLGNVIQTFVEEYVHLYEMHTRTLEMLQEAGFELPRELRAAAEFALSSRFMWAIASARRSLDPAAYQKAIEIVEEANRRGYDIDFSGAAGLLGEMASQMVAEAMASPIPAKLLATIRFVEVARRLRAQEHLGRAQELYFEAFEQRTDWSEDAIRLGQVLGFGAGVARRFSVPPKRPSEA
jgi:hypothetical protein